MTLSQKTQLLKKLKKVLKFRECTQQIIDCSKVPEPMQNVQQNLSENDADSQHDEEVG